MLVAREVGRVRQIVGHEQGKEGVWPPRHTASIA